MPPKWLSRLAKPLCPPRLAGKLASRVLPERQTREKRPEKA